MDIVQMIFNGTVTRAFASDMRLGDACLAVAAELRLSPGEATAPGMSWLVALEDGASYSANAYTSDETIGDFTLGAETPRLFLGVVETCSHGSPFVPRLGFVCGRC